ncbi:hypothetical protein, partial [Helicobacter salomonis]|uniref:hypothetical protein n=1 Tax=Helicobacter salomonis TaxID=56878 RepID=UPI001F1F3706
HGVTAKYLLALLGAHAQTPQRARLFFAFFKDLTMEGGFDLGYRVFIIPPYLNHPCLNQNKYSSMK